MENISEDEDAGTEDESSCLGGGGSGAGNGAGGAGAKDLKNGKIRKKKTRTVFSRSQVFQLESTFDIKRYLSSSERAGLAASLQLSETQVLISFFYNQSKLMLNHAQLPNR